MVATATARLPEAASSEEAADVDVDFARLARFFETPKMEVAALE